MLNYFVSAITWVSDFLAHGTAWLLLAGAAALFLYSIFCGRIIGIGCVAIAIVCAYYSGDINGNTRGINYANELNTVINAKLKKDNEDKLLDLSSELNGISTQLKVTEALQKQEKAASATALDELLQKYAQATKDSNYVQKPNADIDCLSVTVPPDVLRILQSNPKSSSGAAVKQSKVPSTRK